MRYHFYEITEFHENNVVRRQVCYNNSSLVRDKNMGMHDS